MYLTEGEVMDRALYVELIEDKFDDWRLNCDFLVCDYEGCLRTPEAVYALNRCGLQLVDGYPKVSQDFNAIENAWAIGYLARALGRNVPCRSGGQGRFREALARRSTVGQHAQVRSALDVIDEPEGEGDRLPGFNATWSSDQVVSASR